MPDHIDAHYNLGSTYYKLGRYQEVIASSKEAIRIKPDFGNAYLNLGLAHKKTGRYDDAQS